MRKTSVLLLIAVMLLSGCESSEQLGGVFMGGSLGGIFGSSIGGLMDGPRGADAGQALGMVIGGVAGAAITSSGNRKSVKSNRSRYSDSESDYASNDVYSSGSNRSQKNQSYQSGAVSIPDGYSDLQVENLRFIDQNNNHTIDALERSKLVFEIRNNGSQTLYNIAPVIGVSVPKRILVSPTAIIASIAPGKSVRYTAELYGKKRLDTGVVDCSIGFAVGKLLYTVRRFQLSTSNVKAQ